MERAEKEAEVKFLTDCFTKSKVALCADYRGLTVGQVTKLRKEIRGMGAVARVTKNTLARISAQKVYGDSAKAQELENFLKLLEGPSMLFFSYTDPVAPAKVLAKFAKDNEKLRIKGGWLDGSCMDSKAVDALSKLPGREETLAKLLSLINTPARQLMQLLKTPGTQTVRVIDEQRKKIEAKGA